MTITHGLIAAIIAALMFAILAAADYRDQVRNAWMRDYEACVRLEYDTTPVRWYYDHGYYPHCNKFNN